MPTANKKQQILILGHSGFVGKEIYRAAKSSGFAVKGLSSNEINLTQSKSSSALQKYLNSKTNLIICSGLQKRFGDDPELLVANVTMATNIAVALQEADCRKVTFFSTAGVYGEEIHNSKISEKTTALPTSFYALSKLISENILTSLLEARGIPLLILRPPFIYGAEDNNSYGPSGFLKSAVSSQEIVVWGDGTEKRNFIHVSDVANICLKLTMNKESGIFNLCSNSSHSFKQVLKVVETLCPKDFKIEQRSRTKEKVDSCFKAGRLKKVFPNYKFVGLQEGMQKTLQILQRGVQSKRR